MKRLNFLLMMALALVSANSFAQPTAGSPLEYTSEKYYQIYSFGSDEGKNVDNPKYLYAADAVVKWVEVAPESDLATELTANSIDEKATQWQIIPSTETTGTVFLKNGLSGGYITQGPLSYTDAEGAEKTVTSAVLSETPKSLYVLYQKDDTKNEVAYNTYSIQVGPETDAVGMEVNNASKENNDANILATVQFNNKVADRPRWRWVFVQTAVDAPEVNAPQPTTPTLVKVSGANEQTLYAGAAISSIVYRWGGTATSAAVTWDVEPAGITATPNAEDKTVTIAGTPTAAGVYSYSVTATDGTATTEALTGTVTVNALTKPLIAYVTSSATPTDEGDVAIINKLKETYDVLVVVSSETSVNLSACKAVILAALPGSGNVGSQYKGIDKPFVNLKPFMFQSSRWNWATPNNVAASDKTMATAFASVNSVVADHPVFAGITGTTVAMATDSKHADKRILTPIDSWVGENGAKATVLATIANAADGTPYSVADAPIIFEFAPGSVLSNGTEETTITQKTINIGVSEQTAGFLTPEFLTIVSNAVNYVIGEASGIGNVVAGAKAVVSKTYYDLAGRQVSAVSKGILIQKSVHEDGSISYGKVYVK
jgi:hypothetical protein